MTSNTTLQTPERLSIARSWQGQPRCARFQHTPTPIPAQQDRHKQAPDHITLQMGQRWATGALVMWCSTKLHTCDTGDGGQYAEADHCTLTPMQRPMQLLPDAQLQQPFSAAVQSRLTITHVRRLMPRARLRPTVSPTNTASSDRLLLQWR